MPIALIVLLLAFGTVVSALIPLTVGFVGVGLVFGILGILNSGVPFDVLVESIVTMVGLAIGIDYSLLLVTRYRALRRQTRTPALMRLLRSWNWWSPLSHHRPRPSQPATPTPMSGSRKSTRRLADDTAEAVGARGAQSEVRTLARTPSSSGRLRREPYRRVPPVTVIHHEGRR